MPIVRFSTRTLIAALALASVSSHAIAQESYNQIPRDAFSVTATVRAKPGKEDALRAAALPLIALVRGDPKNLVYFLQEDRETSGQFVFYEIFASETDFQAHNEMPYVKEFLAKLPELADGGVEVVRMQVLHQPMR